MSRRTQKNVGLIGLGIIGRRVADNLRRRGFHVFVWNRTPRPYPNFVGSPSELAELCDFIQIFVSDDDALLDMVQQMKPSLHVQHVIMAHSTVAPHTMRNAAEIVKRRGAQFLDAPFTGSKIPAEKGELVYYVAGDDAAFRRARPVLEASSKEIVEIGEIGQATTVKIATNMVTAASVQAAAEALALVQNAGLAPEKFVAALRGNASNSATLTMKLPKMIEGDFDPHFSVKHMLKDVQIAARMARSYGLTLGATEAARDSLLDEADAGRGDQDFSSLIRFYFPEGLTREEESDEADDAQQKLNGVEEEAAAQAPRETAPEATREDESDAASVRPGAATEVAADDEEERAASADEEETSDRPDADDEESREEPASDSEPPATTAIASDEPRADGEDDDKPEAETAAAPSDEIADAVEETAVEAREPETDNAREEQTEETEEDRPAQREADTEAKADAPTAIAEEEEPAPEEPVTSVAPTSEPTAGEPAVHDLTGEPPRERRANGEREPGTVPQPADRDELAARRSFLSRMFGKGDDY